MQRMRSTGRWVRAAECMCLRESLLMQWVANLLCCLLFKSEARAADLGCACIDLTLFGAGKDGGAQARLWSWRPLLPFLLPSCTLEYSPEPLVCMWISAAA